MKKRYRKGKKQIAEMSHQEIKDEMTEIITRDVMRFVQIVTEQRVKLFVDAIYEGIQK